MNENQRNSDTRELMIRLDERMKSIQVSVNEIKTLISLKVENDSEYKEMVAKVNKMWDLKNRAMGYIGAWTALIALIITIAVEYIRGLFFK